MGKSNDQKEEEMGDSIRPDKTPKISFFTHFLSIPIIIGMTNTMKVKKESILII